MNCLDHALLYAEKWGFAVFPVYWIEDDGECACPRRERCHSPGKHPITSDGFKSATREAQQIELWWHAHPNANIGIATGAVSGIVVLDVDPRHGGFESLAMFSLPELETTMKCRTGGGGEHYYFHYPADLEVKNSAGKLGTGLDVRGEGGYVVAPPSNHLKGVYAWERWEDMSEWPDVFRGFSDADQKLPSFSRRGGSAESGDGVVTSGVVSLTSDKNLTGAEVTTPPRRASAPLLEKEGSLRCVPTGQRNSTLASLGGTMRRRGFSVEAMINALLAENEARCQPPLERAEVVQIAHSIGRYQSGESNQSGNSGQSGKSGRESAATTTSQNFQDFQDRQDLPDFQDSRLVWNLSEFLAHTFERKEVICFQAGRADVVMVSAKTNGGKSTLLRNALLQLATGREFAPFVPAGQPPRRVMLLDFEADSADLQSDLATMTAHFTSVDRELLAEHFHLVPKSMFGGGMLQMSEHFDLIQNIITGYASEVVVIDNISSAFEVADENSNAEMNRKVVKPLTRLALETGATIVFAHHIGKAAENSRDDFYQGRGASTLGCLTKSSFVLKGRVDQGEPAEIACVKQKNGLNFTGLYRLDTETRWFTPFGGATPVRKPTNYDLIIQWVKENSTEDKPAKTAEIVAAFPNVSRTAVTIALRDAVIRGAVKSPVRGAYTPAESELC